MYAHPSSMEIDEPKPVNVVVPVRVRFPFTMTVEPGMVMDPVVIEPTDTHWPFSQFHDPDEGAEPEHARVGEGG
jgi:hypothetical protein